MIFLVENFNANLVKKYEWQFKIEQSFYLKDNKYIIFEDIQKALVIFTFPDLSLYKVIQQETGPYVNRYVMLPNQNILVIQQANSSFKSFDLYQIFYPQYNYDTSQITTFGLTSVLQIDNEVYLCNYQGYVQMWDLTNKQLKYGFYNYNEDKYLTSKMYQIKSSPNQVILLYSNTFILFERQTFKIINQQINFCEIYDFLPDDISACILQSSAILFDQDLNKMGQIFLPISMVGQVYTRAYCVKQNSHIFMFTTLGNVLVYKYSKIEKIVDYLYTINGDSSRIQRFIIDQNNSLVIFSYYSGLINCYDYYSIPLILNDQKCADLKNIDPSNISLMSLDVQDKRLLVRRQNSSKMVVLNYPSLTKITNDSFPHILFLQTKKNYQYIFFQCREKNSNYFINKDLQIIILTCIGQYSIYDLSSYKLIGKISVLQYLGGSIIDYENRRGSQMLFLTDEIFIDYFTNIIIFFRYDKLKKILSYIGEYTNQFTIKSIVSYSVLTSKSSSSTTQTAKLIVYGYYLITELTIPISSYQNFCQITINYSQISYSIEMMRSLYSYTSSFNNINQFQILLALKDSSSLPYFPNLGNNKVEIQLVSSNDNSIKSEVFATDQFFQSINNFNSLIMKDLKIDFSATDQLKQYNSTFYGITYLKLTNIEIVSSWAMKRIEFKNIQSIQILNITYSNSIINFKNSSEISLIKQNKLMNSFIQVVDCIDVQIRNIQIQNVQLLKKGFFNVTSTNYEGIMKIDPSTFSKFIVSNFIVKNCKFNEDAIDLFKDIDIDFYLFNFYMISEINIDNLNMSQVNGAPLEPVKIFSVQASMKFILRNSQIQDNKYISLLNQTPYFLIGDSQTSIFRALSNIISPEMKQMLEIKNSFTTLSDNIIQNIQTNSQSKSFITIKGYQFIIENSEFSQFTFENTIDDQKINLIDQLEINYIKMKNVSLTEINNFSQNILSFLDCKNISINNLRAKNNTQNKMSLIYVQDSTLDIKNSRFYNNTANSSAAIMYILNSKITIQYSNIQQSNSDISGGGFYIYKSTFTSTNVSFINVTSAQQGGAIYSYSSVLNIVDNFFTNTLSSQGGSIYAESASRVTLLRINTSSSKAISYGGVLYLKDNSYVNIDSSTFETSQSLSGGSIYMFSCLTPSKIKNSTFQNNVVQSYGGAVLLDKSQLSIEDSKFYSNKAGVGGAIRFLNYIPQFIVDVQKELQQKISLQQTTIGSNQFKGNIASVYGANIASQPTIAKLYITTTKFELIKGNAESPYYQDDLLKNNYQYIFRNFRSGEKDFTMQIQLNDAYGQDILSTYQSQAIEQDQDINKEYVNLRSKLIEIDEYQGAKTQKVSLEGQIISEYNIPNKLSSNKGFIFNSLEITGVPEQSVGICLNVNGLYKIKGQDLVQSPCVNLQVQFRMCEVGEIFQPKCADCIVQKCNTCQNGTYSIVKPQFNSSQSCQPCDYSNSQTCFSNQIKLLPNYWRKDNFTDEIIQCEDKLNSCNGDETNGYCRQGYIGPLCESCDNYGTHWGEKYSLVSAYRKTQCIKCDEMVLQQIIQVIIFILTSLYLTYQITTQHWKSIAYVQGKVLKQLGVIIMGTSLTTFQLSIISKLLIHYMSIQSIVDQFNIQYNEVSTRVTEIPSTFLIPMGNVANAFDCILANKQSEDTIPIEYYRFIFTYIQCLAIFSLISLIQKIIETIGRRQKLNQNYIMAYYNSPSVKVSKILFILFFIQQCISTASLRIMSCKKIGKEYYIMSQINKNCYTAEHYSWMPFFFTSYIFFSFGFPLIVLILLYKSRNELYHPYKFKAYRKYFFIYSEYKQKTYWWEILKMVQRQIVTVITNTAQFSQIQRGLIIVLILILYLIISCFARPYQNEQLNKLDHTFNLFTIIIISLSIVQYDLQTDAPKKLISLFIIMLQFIIFSNNQLIQYHFKQQLNFIKYIVMIACRLIQSFLQINMRRFLRSKLLSKGFKVMQWIMPERIFFQRSGYLRTSLPSLYLLIYRQDLIGSDNLIRWKIVRSHFINLLKQIKRDRIFRVDEYSQYKLSSRLDQSKKSRFILKEMRSQMSVFKSTQREALDSNKQQQQQSNFNPRKQIINLVGSDSQRELKLLQYKIDTLLKVSTPIYQQAKGVQFEIEKQRQNYLEDNIFEQKEIQSQLQIQDLDGTANNVIAYPIKLLKNDSIPSRSLSSITLEYLNKKPSFQ